MKILVLIGLLVGMTGCASNILVSDCKSIQIDGEESGKWLCSKGWSDYWR